MKKYIIATVLFSLIVGNAFAFQIGIIGGCSYGESLINGKTNPENPCGDTGLGFNPNGALVIPHEYGFYGLGGCAEVGWMGCTPKISYNFKYKFKITESFNIQPFLGVSYCIPVGFGFNAGVAFGYALGIGDIYADMRYEPNSSFRPFIGGSVNVGYVFKFGKDKYK